MSARCRVQTYPDGATLAADVASRWLDELSAVRDSSFGRSRMVALSGGRSARDFFHAIAKRCGGSGHYLQGVQFFWADERCVPPDHAESNYRLAWIELLEPLAIPSDSIHRLQGEHDPAVAAALAEAELRRVSGQSVPQLDWVFLGMGADGHVASLFPGRDGNARDPSRMYIPVIGPKPPRRLSLTYAALAAAKEVWVLVSGAGKQEALEASLAAEGTTPLAEVIRSRSATRLFTDARVRHNFLEE